MNYFLVALVSLVFGGVVVFVERYQVTSDLQKGRAVVKLELAMAKQQLASARSLIASADAAANKEIAGLKSSFKAHVGNIEKAIQKEDAAAKAEVAKIVSEIKSVL